MGDGSELEGVMVIRGLIRVSEHLSSRTSLDDRMGLLCEETCTMLGCDRASIMVWDGTYYRAAYNFGNPPDIAKHFPKWKVSPRDPLIAEMNDRRTFVVINDARSHPHTREVAAAARIDSIVVAPMFDPADGSRVAFMTSEFNERLGVFDDEQAEIVLGVARLAQAAIITERERTRRRRAGRGQRRLLEQLVSAEERERRHLTAELHDDPLQRLVALQHELDCLATEVGDTAVSARIGELADDCEETGARLRRVLRGVRRDRTTFTSFADEVGALLDDLVAATGIATRLTDEIVAEPSPEVVAVGRRVVQQALRNVARHAQASRVDVQLSSVGDGTRIALADDGVGFDPASVPEGCFGIVSMTDRAEGLGGRLSIESVLGSGTTVEVILPELADSPS